MQSFLQYRRYGIELRAVLERDNEAFHRQHSHSLEDRTSLHQSLHSGHSRHAALGDQFYLTVASFLTSHESSKYAETRDGSNPLENTGGLDKVLDGIETEHDTRDEQNQSRNVFVVRFAANDADNPHNWSTPRRIFCLLQVASIGFLALFSSSVDAAVAPQAAAAFQVDDLAESLATGMWLIGSGLGSMIVGPFSETFGRNPVYTGSMLFFMIFNMATAVSPDFAAQIVFRFFVGVFAAPPLVCGGGTISDLFNPLERIWAFPLYAIIGFGGPMLGPVVCSYVYLWDWRWADWITLIMGGIVFCVVTLLLPETHPAIIQSWKAKQLRNVTLDDRYQAPSELTEVTFVHRLTHALTRPLILGMEPIVIAISIYLTIIWTVLFIFLDGYTRIFQKTYEISQGLTNILFIAEYVGVLAAIPLVLLVYRLTKRDMTRLEASRNSNRIRPETRQYFAMLGGGWAVPVSLFWLAWTSRAGISIWSPLVSTAFFGFGLITIFFSAYLYVIDAYEVNAASALAFTTVTRYVVSGGVTVGGIPFFKNVAHHWVLTILRLISLVLGAPVPYLLYWYGPALRRRSKNAVNKD